MSTATCPKCHLQVSLPNTDDHTVWVRCPLCGGQYSLRSALDHVPPSLEILGPPADAAMAAPGEMAALGEMPAQAMPADTLAHPEHGAMLAPLDAEQFLQPDESTNGEHTIDLESAAPSEQAAGQPPALDRVGGEPHDASQHFGDFDLESAEHSEHAAQDDLLEHDPAAAAFGEPHGDSNGEQAGGVGLHGVGLHGVGLHGEHSIEPLEASAEGDPEFRFAEAEAGGGGDGDDAAAMGGIATMLKAAPPAKKRRQAPPLVKFIGVLVGLGFGVIGCYLVIGVFLLIGNQEAAKWGRQFNLKAIYPAFISKHIADEPPPPPRHSKTPERLTPGSTPVATPPAGTAITPVASPAGQPAAPDNGAVTPSTAPPSGNNPAVAGQPKTPEASPGKAAPSEVAQQSPNKSSGPPLETEDPTKTPPPDFDKPDTKSDLTKPDSPNIAPPKFDTPALPFGDAKPPERDSEKNPGKTPEKTPEKSATPATPDKLAPLPESPPATAAKPAATPDKPEPPVATPPAVTPPAVTPPAVAPPAVAPPAVAPPAATLPAATPPAATAPAEKTPETAASKSAERTTEKPVGPPAEKPDEHSAAAEAKPPVADQLANVDVALTFSTQTAENLKSTAVPGADPRSVLMASVANYKAMSHLATELGALGSASADPAFATRIEKLRKKAAALAEAMGSPAERDTTAKLASKWMGSPSRKESGAVIVGTLVKVEPTGKGFVAHIKMSSDAKEMDFTTTKKPEAADGSPVVVLGLLNTDEKGTALEILPSPDDKSPAPPADKPPAK